MLCCPLTTQIKGYPFEVTIAGEPVSVVLADQVKSLDYAMRQARFKSKVSARELAEIRAKATALIGRP
jgi:mRNA interferase MazF